ncbi:helix-turn-helix domain-containing protein [Singulisphaera sp. PoT]|uniref:AraC family transcriptional regulator n=1 Tax=Singulisphaera sp. PoT TaxID=3411797 RepID=UPI003BF4C0BB
MRGHREPIHPPSGHSFRVLRWGKTLREVDVVIGPGQRVPIHGEGEHWHYHVAMELTLFTAGEGTRFVGDHIGRFSSGDLVLLGEKLPHHWHTHGSSTGISVQWEFSPGHPFWAFPETGSLGSLFKNSARGLRFSGGAAQTVSSGLHELLHTSGADQLGLLLRLLARLAAAGKSECATLSEHSFALPNTSEHQQAIAEAVRYLLANFRDEIRLEEVLDLTEMSKPTFTRQFKRHSGKTFSDFVSQVRLEAACRDLAETDRPVLEIAQSCGFSQLSFFNRLFRRIRQCTPTEYRNRMRQS